MSQQIDFEGLLAEIQTRALHKTHGVIAISGFGGSGKSTLAAKLAARLGDTTVIHLDDFIIDHLSARSQDWDGFDWDRLVAEVLAPIAGGAHSVEYGIYDWQANAVMEEKNVALQKYVILEGVGLIREHLRKYFDMTVWLDVPLDVASDRGKRRDVDEYGLPYQAERWDAVWTPNDREYFAKYHPRLKADFLLENQPYE